MSHKYFLFGDVSCHFIRENIKLYFNKQLINHPHGSNSMHLFVLYVLKTLIETPSRTPQRVNHRKKLVNGLALGTVIIITALTAPQMSLTLTLKRGVTW